MSEDGAGPLDREPDELLVVMREGRDRQLLVEYLEATGGYSVSALAPGSTPPPGYDLCLLGPAGLESALETLSGHAEAADPVFLPHLLLVPDEEVALDPPADRLVDDVITMPVEQEILRRRIENLLRTRRASVSLAQRQEQYRQLVELTPETILLLRDDRIVYANAAAAETFDVDEPAALDGEDVSRLVPDAGRADLATLVETVRRDGRLDEFREIRMETVAGAGIDAEVAGVTVTFEGDPATQLLIRDVTEQRRRQQRLTLFGQAIETAMQGITIADARQDDEPLIYANAAFERITGYPTAEVLGRNCRFLQGPETDEATVAEVHQAIAEREPVSVELLNYRKDSTPFWNHLEIVPVENESGTVTHFLGLQRDVTGRREREERLAVLDRVLRHNIRNRMNVIRSYAELLRDGDGDAGDESERIDAIVNAADDLIRISEQVRKFQSIISTDEHTLKEYDLSELLARAIETVRADHPDADLVLDTPAEAIATVHPTASAALQEVLELAFENVAPGERPAVTVRVELDAEHVTVDVVDRGNTVPRQDMEAVSRGTETALEHATGLELWLIRWAVLYSDGGVSIVDGADDRKCLRLRFRRP
ncbi:MAG: PAS domain-containing protein [Salinirussus sp.]